MAIATRERQYTGTLNTVLTVVSMVMVLYVILYVSHTFDRLGMTLLSIQHRGLFLAFIIFISFLVLPMRKGEARDKLPWYDILFMVVGITGPLYAAFSWIPNADRFAFEEYYLWEGVLGILTMVVILEITRRAVGPVFPIFAALFLIHMFFGDHFPGFLYTQSASLNRAMAILIYSAEGVYGIALGVASTVIILFILFGQLLFTTPAGQFFINLSMSLLGHVRGGPAKVAVFASSFFGTMSGSPMANVAVTGTFTIPMMKRIGYTPNFSGAVESVASTGGQLMPPIMGATAFIMAEWLGIPYWGVCVAAFLPILLYYVAVFMMVDAEAVRLGLRGLPREECPSLKKTLLEGWIALVPLVVLIFLLAVFNYSAQYAALFAIAALLIINLLNKKTRLRPTQFVTAIRGTGMGILSAGSATACAGIVMGALGVTQLGIKLTDIVVTASGGNMWLLLVLAAATCFVLGMGMPAIPAYIMVVIFVAPALLDFDIAPLSAHLFIFYWAVVSFFTPPVAGACFVAIGITGGSLMKTGLISMRLGIIAYIIPFMFVTDPSLILQGAPGDILLHFFTALAGVVLLSWGLTGQALKPANWLQRALFIGGGLLLIMPGWATDVIGLALGVVGLLWQLRFRAQTKLPDV